MYTEAQSVERLEILAYLSYAIARIGIAFSWLPPTSVSTSASSSSPGSRALLPLLYKYRQPSFAIAGTNIDQQLSAYLGLGNNFVKTTVHSEVRCKAECMKMLSFFCLFFLCLFLLKM